MPNYTPNNRLAASGALTPSVLFAATVLTRLPFASKLLYNMDSVQFALGMRNFDVALHQPQPPGYYLYVLMGRAAYALTGDDNTALLAVSILFSGLAVVMLNVLASEMFGRRAGVTAAVIGITSPLMWFHGEVALSYMPEAFMSLLVAWLCLRAARGDARCALAASVALGIAGGIRQNTMVFLMPLWLYGIYRYGAKKTALCMAAFAATVLAWFLPMLAETGGYSRYSAALSAHWLNSNWRGIHLHWILFNARYLAYFIMSGLAIAVVPLLDWSLGLVRGRVSLSAAWDMALFFMLWLLPAFLFHLVVFTHPAVAGHCLIYLVGLIILAARAVEYTAEGISRVAPGLPAQWPHTVLAAALVAVNAAFFMLAPYPLYAKGIKKHDRLLSDYIEAIGAGFDPQDTIIIGTDRFLYSYRHAMYYLPEFTVYDTVRLSTPHGPMLLWGKGRETRMARRIEPAPGTRRYVDFLNYDESDIGALPPGARIMHLDGGGILVYYDDIGSLYGVDRIAPFLATYGPGV